jgi:hypothetical protein
MVPLVVNIVVEIWSTQVAPRRWPGAAKMTATGTPAGPALASVCATLVSGGVTRVMLGTCAAQEATRALVESATHENGTNAQHDSERARAQEPCPDRTNLSAV